MSGVNEGTGSLFVPSLRKETVMPKVEITLTDAEYERLNETPGGIVRIEQFLRYSLGSPTKPAIPRSWGLNAEQQSGD